MYEVYTMHRMESDQIYMGSLGLHRISIGSPSWVEWNVTKVKMDNIHQFMLVLEGTVMQTGK
jgi:hypothetical protein